MLRRLLPDTFILLLLATVGLATLFPAQGLFAAIVDHAATAAIVLLFFFHGARLSRQSVLAGLVNWRLHVMILATTFLLFPLLGLATVALAGDRLARPVAAGIVYLCLLPSTVQSSIAFTSMARGNVPAAVASSSASQLLGVFLTPLLVGLLLGRQGAGFSFASLGTVLLIVLLPFVVGHLARPLIGGWVDRNRKIVGINDKAAILISVYGAFSEAMAAHIWQRLPPVELLLIAAICVAMLAVVLAFTWFAGARAGLPRGDRIALLFCGSKKSLVQGIPMARVLFAGPDLGLILLPVMIFHQIQLMACAWIAGRLGRQQE